MDHPEDTVERTVEVYLAWAEHRCVLLEAISGSNFSHPALLQPMV